MKINGRRRGLAVALVVIVAALMPEISRVANHLSAVAQAFRSYERPPVGGART